MNKLLKWGVIALLVWWAVTNPAGASLAVHHLASFATRAATSATTLISSF